MSTNSLTEAQLEEAMIELWTNPAYIVHPQTIYFDPLWAQRMLGEVKTRPTAAAASSALLSALMSRL